MRKRKDSGQLFLDNCQGLTEERQRSRVTRYKFNQVSPEDEENRELLKKEIFGKETNVFIESPFYFTYGTNIDIGHNCYINYNCNFIDDGQITIGDTVMFGSNVTIATVGLPIHPEHHRFMYTKPVTIKNNCWIGAGSVINPGVTIGENSVIGSGSVVTKDIPANSFAVGNPCRVIREINEEDLMYYQPGCPIDIEELEQVRRTNENT